MIKFTKALWTILLLCMLHNLSAQDNFPGKWEVQYKPWPHIPAIKMELAIYEPIQGMVYPTILRLSNHLFEGEYDFLLIKKDDNQLGIARNKYPILEKPFPLKSWMMYLNGHFELDEQSEKLILQRLWIDRFGIFMDGLYDDELFTHPKTFLRDFLYQVPITLERKNKIKEKHPREKEILGSEEIYYGIYDPIKVNRPELRISVLDEEKFDKDTVTIVHNGKIIIDKLPVGETMFMDDITLEEGDNYFAFFAENYGDLPPNTANFLIYTEGGDEPQYSFDFTHRSNVYATAMVAHFIYEKPKLEENKVQQTQKVLKDGDRDNFLIGRLQSSENKVLLKIWDAQQEDGDLITIHLNGKPLLENMEVRHQPRFIEITLKKGVNQLLFRAENVGRIPPNTGVVELSTKDFQRQILFNTDMNRSNYIEILNLE